MYKDKRWKAVFLDSQETPFRDRIRKRAPFWQQKSAPRQSRQGAQMHTHTVLPRKKGHTYSVAGLNVSFKLEHNTELPTHKGCSPSSVNLLPYSIVFAKMQERLYNKGKGCIR